MARAKRRLAAILAADAAGYSRLMGDDERATLDTLNAYREVFKAHVGKHEGRVVDTAGDSVLAVFESVVEAVQCAVDVQAELEKRNADLTEARRMRFRIGVNSGDIIEQDDGTLYGDGVNVAARLQSLAEPAGITLSEDAYRNIRGKLDLDVENIGNHEVKNIAEPVQVYSVAHSHISQETETRSGLKLPDKPSIAVLPFDNLSGDAEQEYFADGIAEDLITALSRARWLFVIARNSTFAYKGKSPDARSLGRDLGVRYLVEGSVRRGADRIRITVQLIDTTTGAHIWADRYDRQIADLFVVQDEITEMVVAAIEVELGAAERERARRKSPDSLDAWESYQKGMWHLYHFSAAEIDVARGLFLHAGELEPSFAPCQAAISYSYFLDTIHGYCKSPIDSASLALEFGRKAVSLDNRDAMAHFALGRSLQLPADFEGAIGELSKSAELDPNFAPTYLGLALCHSFAGQLEEAVTAANKGERLSPNDPFLWTFQNARAVAYLSLGEYDMAARNGLIAHRNPTASFWPHVNLAAAQGHLGRMAEAKAAFETVFRLNPGFSVATIKETHFPLRHDFEPDYFGALVTGLHRAGLQIPDQPIASG